MKYTILYMLLIFPMLMYSQNLEIKIISDRNIASINQTVKITIYTNQKGEITEKWPKYFHLKNTPSFSSKFMKNPQTGTIEQEHVITYLGSFSESGLQTIGPFEINLEGKKQKSNVIQINILKEGSKAQNQSASSDLAITEHIELNKTVIYEGESVHLSNFLIAGNPYGKVTIKQPLKLSGNVDNFALPVTYNWYEIDSDGLTTWQYPLNSILIYPLISDKFKIDPSEILYSNVMGNNIIKTTVPTIRIKPLPALAPNSFYGAVGHFEIKQTSKNQNLRQGDVVPLELTITGEGNFHQFVVPKIKLPLGVEFYGEPTISESIQHSEKGTVGQITYKYNLQIFEIGVVRMPPIPFTYFDLKSEKYITIKDTSTITFNILSNAEYQRDYTKHIQSIKRENISPFTTTEPSAPSNYIINSYLYWLILLGLPIGTFSILILSRKENVFLEERFKKLKRKPNYIKRKLKKLSVQKNRLSQDDLKDVIALITLMINKRNQKNIAHEDNLLIVLNDLKSIQIEDEENYKELRQIVELIFKNIYAFDDPNSTKEIIETVNKIAQKWKQI